MSAATNKWILTVPREIHLGFIKETFGRGTVIELDTERGMLIIDGRKFDDTRDLELLQRASIKNPDRPWIVPYSDEAYAQVVGGAAVAEEEVPPPKPRPGADLPVVQDDSSDHPVIDIRHTQISKQHQAEKEAARTAAHNREVGRDMEVIRGDETAEERIARLKGKGDMASLTQRVAAKRERAQMPIVHDDSLGMGVGKSEIPLNAGQHLPSREEADAKAEEQAAMADLRKQQVEMTRKRAGVEVPEPGKAVTTGEIDQDIPPELAEASEVVGGTTAEEIQGETQEAVSGATVSDEDVAALEADFEAQAGGAAPEPGETVVSDELYEKVHAENEVLKAENEELKGGLAAVMARLDALESKPAAKKTAKKTTKTAKKVTRTPVTQE